MPYEITEKTTPTIIAIIPPIDNPPSLFVGRGGVIGMDLPY